MPIYTFLNTETEERFDISLRIDQREEYLASNPHLKQVLSGAPTLHSGTGLTGRKPDNAFRDKLKEIKKAHSQGITERSKAKIHTF